MISAEHKRLIQSVINVFETGTPEGRYDALVVMADGRNGTRQITFGRSQTTEQGNLRQLIDMYIDAGGRFANELGPFVTRIGAAPLADDEGFKRLLVQAAREDPLMRTTQDEFFDRAYWTRAMKWFDTNGFTLPLSALVVYDSYIHSGRVPMFLRRRFMESPPASGGSEQKWTASYVESRHQWLKHHRNELLRRTIYRTRTFLDEIERDNWRLKDLPIDAHGVAVS